MSLQYISDNAGVTTAVVIPIQEWEAIVEKHKDLKELDKPVAASKKQKPSDYKGILSKKEAAGFNKHLTKARKEWDRDSY